MGALAFVLFERDLIESWPTGQWDCDCVVCQAIAIIDSWNWEPVVFLPLRNWNTNG
jgi:hypothetical protein